jgi:hypothetical protein
MINTTEYNKGESNVSYEFVERDLAHIQNIIGLLERSIDSLQLMETGPVVSLTYWRTRVTTILATPSLPHHMEKQARELLGRLDCLDEPRRRNASGDNVDSPFPAQ